MKKSVCFLLAVLVLLISFSGLTAYAATGSLTAAASGSSITVGSTVTVTLKYSGGSAKIGSLDAQLSYNAAAFEYVSCDDGVTASGGAGVVRMSYFATGTAPTTVTATLKFKAITAGAANFAVTTTEFINDDDYSSLGTPSQTLSVSAINPTKSANANLASLKPSSGTLTPKFSANVTNYTISVPYTTTSLSLSATTQDKDAKIAVSGKNALAVGKNTQVITVTAPNGTTKKYTVVITRSANQATTTSGTNTSTTTTIPPQEDALEVEVDGEILTVADTQPNAELPSGYAWNHITINNVNVSAAVNQTINVTLVYLVGEQSDSGNFYLYDEATGTFSRFRPLTVSGGSYILRELPVDMIAPAGTISGSYTFGDNELGVYRFEDVELADVLLVYATSPVGKTGLYCYDTTDGSMQLYREITVAADVPLDSDEPTKDNFFASFLKQNRKIILLCAAALGGLALAVAAVLLISLTVRKDKNCKH